MACEHKNFDADVKVARLEDTGNFMAEVRIECADCGKPFQFNGLNPGLDLHGATVSLDGLEVRISISPENSKPNPMQVMGFGVRKFDG